MTLRKILLPLMLAISLASATASAQQHQEQDHNRFLDELNERDWEVLRDFLKTKREETIAKKAAQITLSGDVRFEYRNLHEHCAGHQLRGGKDGRKCVDGKRKGLPISKNDFDIEFNLRLDYKGECTWAVAHVQYDNSAGVDDGDLPCKPDPWGYHGSGICDDLCLKKAYWGMHLYKEGSTSIDIELGRRNLYNVFDSRVQFLSRFDGVTLKYDTAREGWGGFYWYGAAFVVDERVNHFAWITELGLLNILDSGFDLKYSLIDWNKRGRNRCEAHNPRGFHFLNSQVTAAYHFTPSWICSKRAKLFGAFVYNHQGQRVKYYNFRNKHRLCRTDEDNFIHDGHKRIPDTVRERVAKDQNKAWYVGFLVGEVEKEGDWSFEVMYQWVQAFAMPDNDMSGIGRGNTLDDQITAAGARGNTNFRGWRLESLYAITDDLTLDTIIEWSNALNKKIGGTHQYSKIEFETIYAF